MWPDAWAAPSPGLCLSLPWTLSLDTAPGPPASRAGPVPGASAVAGGGPGHVPSRRLWKLGDRGGPRARHVLSVAVDLSSRAWWAAGAVARVLS